MKDTTSSVSEILASTTKGANVNVIKINTNNVKYIAAKLVDKLQDPTSHKFFCKVAWALPESIIWLNLEQALSGRNPKAYFTFLCKMSMKP